MDGHDLSNSEGSPQKTAEATERADDNDSSLSFDGTGQCFSLIPYLTEDAKKNLREFQYAGADYGFMYKYFYSPFANWCVQRIPEWIAPNLITLTGFITSLIPFSITFIVYGTHLNNEDPALSKLPNWLYGLTALCYFAYRMLDEMDGKQARRTGNSSPLGMLFDHGIDAYTIGIQVLMMAKLTQMGNLGLFFVFGSCMDFYVCTLQEYYQGGLFLPFGNAITD